MTRTVVLFALGLMTSLAAGQEAPATGMQPDVAVPAFRNPNCPVMGKPTSSKLWVDTDFGRIYVCCKACNKRILKDPETAHAAAYPRTMKAGNAACPISGKPVAAEAPKVVVQGHEIALCCEKCVPEVRSNAQVVLAKVTRPAVKDLANAVCPVSGQPVVPNAFCIVGDTLVRLSSPECVDEVRKDPAAIVAKAAGAAKPSAAPEKGGPGHEHRHEE